MLPFSSFLTELPLIVMATAYMLYFGAYALNRSKVEENESLLQVEEQSVKHSISGTGNYMYYQHRSFKIGQDASSVTYKDFLFNKSYITLQFYIPDRKIYLDFHTCQLFSRPPPFRG